MNLQKKKFNKIRLLSTKSNNSKIEFLYLKFSPKAQRDSPNRKNY